MRSSSARISSYPWAGLSLSSSRITYLRSPFSNILARKRLKPYSRFAHMAAAPSCVPRSIAIYRDPTPCSGRLSNGIEPPFVAPSGGGGDQEDPDVPGAVAHDQGGQALLPGVERAPERARDSSRPGQGQVLRDQVDPAVDRGGERRRGQATDAPLQGALHQAAPEELLAGPDHEHERGGDRRRRSQGAKPVDGGDLPLPHRHDPARQAIAGLEDAVESGRRGQP